MEEFHDRIDRELCTWCDSPSTRRSWNSSPTRSRTMWFMFSVRKSCCESRETDC
ncbi:hypothetical protein M758_9G049400 [Ceratodon purpureus]|nr:hypothetical protein M758_9G049400 [Ceratodon purpureus]